MFLIDPRSKQPLYEQMTAQLRQQIALGLAEGGAPMPSVRQLSGELGLNPNTIQKAYRQMEQEGLIVSVPGRGSFVTQDVEALNQRRRQAQATLLKNALAEGRVLGVSKQEAQALLDEAYKEEPNC